MISPFFGKTLLDILTKTTDIYSKYNQSNFTI